MADLSHLLLATAALLIHAALLGLAPLLSDLAAITERALVGRAPPALGAGWRDIAGRSAAGRDGVAASRAAFGCTAAAALLVPSFATGMLTAPLDDLPVVALLLVCARLASMPELDPVAMARSLGLAVLSLPALLLASLALSAVAGGTGIDQAAAHAATLPLGLLAVALGCAALADLDQVPRDGIGRATASLRLMVWLDLLAVVAPPSSTTASSAGPAAWAAALVLWPVKVGVLAVGFGAARLALGGLRAAWRVSAWRTASLLALLSGVFVLIGQSFE